MDGVQIAESVFMLASNFGLAMLIVYWFFMKEYPSRRAEEKERTNMLNEQFGKVIEHLALSRQAIEAAMESIEKNNSEYRELAATQSQYSNIITDAAELINTQKRWLENTTFECIKEYS